MLAGAHYELKLRQVTEYTFTVSVEDYYEEELRAVRCFQVTLEPTGLLITSPEYLAVVPLTRTSLRIDNASHLGFQ